MLGLYQVPRRHKATRTILLPNGLRAAYVSYDDIQFFYSEIYEEEVYQNAVVTLKPGDTVIDVGANVGLFSLYAAEKVGKEGKVFAVEPIPATFKAMRYNIAGHAGLCKTSGTEIAHVVPLMAGVSDGIEKEAVFTFYRHAAGMSSMCPNERDVFETMAVVSRHLCARPTRISVSAHEVAFRTLLRLAPRVFDYAARLYTRWMLRGSERVTCELVTVSDVIAAHSLARVDYLKIDVERAELAVLRGIEDRHWPIIRQVVLEVHDLGGEVDAARALLAEKGFRHVVVEQAAEMKGCPLFNVYCRR